MTKWFVFSVVMSAGLIACGGGNPSPPGAASNGAAAELADLRKDWLQQKAGMLKIADAMPEDKFGYKSTPAQRSYGEQIMHIAEVNVEVMKLLRGKAQAPSFTAEGTKSKGQIIKALSDTYGYGTEVLDEQTAATINQVVDTTFAGPSTKARIVWGLLSHTMDIYGQMVVYLRLNDIVPPASRGV